jgi:signal transduction histidine kinase
MSEEQRYQIFALRVVMVGATALAGGLLIIESCDNLGSRFSDGALAIPSSCLVLLMILSITARLGHYRLAATGVVSLCMLLGTYFLVCWSSDVPQGILLYALVVAATGVLLGSRMAIAMAVAAAIAMELLIYGQWRQMLIPDTSWMQRPPAAVDVLLPALSFGFMAALMWVSNRKAEQLLRQPRASEELQRLAGVGQLTAGLLHDVANPLTAASLSLQQLSETECSQLVNEIANNLRHIERYVEAGRKQLQLRGRPQPFEITAEIHEAASLLMHKARLTGVRLYLPPLSTCRLMGDPVRFNRLILNLIDNAIEAYDSAADHPHRCVRVTMMTVGEVVELVVQDWGQGIAAKDLAEVFRLYRTTKSELEGSRGVGLSIVREIVEGDFDGSISVTSYLGAGTQFVVRLPLVSEKEAAGSDIRLPLNG